MFDLILVQGEDAASVLQRLSTADLNKLSSAQPVLNISFLNPKGFIYGLGFVFISAQDKNFYIAVNKTNGTQLTEILNKFIITEDCSFSLHKKNINLQTLYREKLALSLQKKDFNVLEQAGALNIEEFKFNEDSLIKLDLIDKYFPYDKGCFPGQEVLSKYKHIGLKKKQERSERYTREAQDLFLSSNKQNDLMKAKALLEKSIQENMKNEEAYETLAAIYGKIGNYQDAIKTLETLELINPKNIMAKTSLSIFYMKIGDKDKAEEYKAQSTVLQFEEALGK